MREVASLELLLKEAASLNLTPAFIEYEDPLFWREPRSKFVPAQWRYHDMKALLDAAGRVVEIPDQITHVMAAGPPASVILYTLVPEKMIGWVRAWKPDEARYIAPAYRHLPVIGRITGRGNTVTPEAVVKLAPDVIIDVGSVDSSYAELADRFQNQTGIPYVLLDGTLAASADTYRLLGQIVGEPERADALAKYATATLDEVRATLAQVPDGNPRASITAVVRMAWKPAWRGRSTWKCSRRSVR